MRFIVSRTSEFGNGCPCSEAKLHKIARVETRTLHTAEEFDIKFSKNEGKWLEVGTNHRIDERGYITRDRDKVNVWMIELNSLDDLIGFYNKYGKLIIKTCCWNPNYHEIEIYDDYRE